jgi:hypothetical protein
MSSGGTEHHHIEDLKWTEDGTGKSGSMSRAKMVEWVEGGGRAYTLDNSGDKPYLKVRSTSGGHKIRSDGSRRDLQRQPSRSTSVLTADGRRRGRNRRTRAQNFARIGRVACHARRSSPPCFRRLRVSVGSNEIWSFEHSTNTRHVCVSKVFIKLVVTVFEQNERCRRIARALWLASFLRLESRCVAA